MKSLQKHQDLCRQSIIRNLPNLMTYLSQTLTSYDSNRLEYRRAVAKLLVGCHLPHNVEKGAVVISVEYLKLLDISPRLFNKINNDLGLFESNNHYSKDKGHAKAYFPTTTINELLKGYIQFLKSNKALPVEQLRLKRVSKNLFDNGDTQINLTALEALCERYEASNEVYKTFMCSQLIIEAKNNNGVLRGLYAKAESGRLYGVGVSLQNAPKEIRLAALSNLNMIDYDVENCHPALFKHFYNGSLLSLYCTNKESMRNTLAERVGVDVGLIKQALLAMFFGCSMSPVKGALVDILKDKVEVFLNEAFVQGLNKELNQARKAVLNSEEGQKALKTLKRKDLEAMTANQKVAHILQNLESTILMAVINKYQPEYLFHDGFVMSADVCTKELSVHIKEATGFSVEFQKGVV